MEEQIATRYTRLEREVEVLLARQAPVASDLRHVLALLRVNHHLERIGHHAVRIARSTQEPTARPTPSMTAALLGRDGRPRARHREPCGGARCAPATTRRRTGLRELDVEIDTLEGAVAESAMEEFHGTEGGRERVLWALGRRPPAGAHRRPRGRHQPADARDARARRRVALTSPPRRSGGRPAG